MDTAQWPQDLGLVKPMEELVSSANGNSTARPQQQQQQQQQQQMMERRVRPQKEQALHCPRCNSTNTKFCYYNNYSLTQPRYFCKTCRRYWTEGGSLRNVPVGGGSRKNKRSSSSSSTTSSTSTTTNSSTTSSLPTLSSSSKIKLSSDMIPMSLSSSSTQNPKFHEGQDLNLAFHLPEFGHEHFPNMESNSTAATAPLSAMELLRSTGGISGRGGLNIPFMPMVSMPMSMAAEYPSGFGMQDYMRSNTLSFPLDSISERTAGGGSISGGYGSSMQGVQDSTGQRLLFPFEDSRQQVPSTDDDERFDQQNRGQGGGNNPPGFWNGMIGGGGGGGSGSW